MKNLYGIAMNLGLISKETNEELPNNEDRGELLQSYLKNMGMYNLGVRTIDEIQTRFLNKGIHSQSVDNFIKTLNTIYEIISYEGEYTEVLNHVAKNSSTKIREIINDLSNVIDSLKQTVKINNIQIDLSLGKEIPYYTGLVFQITSDYEDKNIIVNQGGRYDDLLRVLGDGQISTPALGFAWNLDALQMISEVGR